MSEGNGAKPNHQYGDEETTKPEVFGHRANKPLAYLLYELSAALNTLSNRIKNMGKKVARSKRTLELFERAELAAEINDGGELMKATAAGITGEQ